MASVSPAPGLALGGQGTGVREAGGNRGELDWRGNLAGRLAAETTPLRPWALGRQIKRQRECLGPRNNCVYNPAPCP